MATTSTEDIITEVGERLRDPTNFAHTRTLVLEILSRVQRVLNIGLKLRILNVLFTPDPKRTIYDVTEIADDIGKIVGIRDGGRDLDEIPWHKLADNDNRWIQRRGPQPMAFSRFGRDLVMIVPCQEISPPQLRVFYTQQSDDLVDDDTDFPTLPDKYIPLLMDLTELILLIRGRIFTPDSAMPELMDRIEAALTTGVVEQGKHHGEG